MIRHQRSQVQSKAVAQRAEPRMVEQQQVAALPMQQLTLAPQTTLPHLQAMST